MLVTVVGEPTHVMLHAELAQLLGEDALVGLEGHVGAHHVGARLLDGQRDRREVLRIVRIALDQDRLDARAS